MEGSLREVIGNYLILNSPPPSNPELMNVVFDESYVKHFSISDQI